MPEISLFKNVGSVKEPVNIDLLLFLENIRDGEWYKIVKECRAIKDYQERKEFKKTLPTATFSGRFTYRNDNGIAEHSGIIAMDIDGLEDPAVVKQVLIRDRFVFACFLSTSGNGLRVLFRIDPEKHDDAFRGLVKYLHKEYGIDCDPNSSLSKPYLVSWDPALFMRMEIEDTPVFKKYVEEKPVKKLTDFVHTDADFHRVLKEIELRGLSIAEDYLDYLKIGFALAKQFGEGGRDYYHIVCRPSQKYIAKKVDRQYDYCLKDNGGKKANIATFYYFAKQSGVQIASENTKIIVRTTKIGRKSGLSKEKITENLEKLNNIKGAFDIVSQVFDNGEDLDEDIEEGIIYLLELFISNNYSLEENEVTGYLEQNRKRLSENDLNSIFIAAKKVIPKLDYQLMLRLLKSEFIPKYNPFFEFFGSDGVAVKLPPIPDEDAKDFDSPMLDLLAQTIENDDPAYTRFFIRKWIVSIISAAHKVHSPLLLCLLGGQNTGKTEWFRRLLPSELQEYYAESKLDKEKDDEILMTENILISDDELGGKSKQDNLKLKNMTSKQWFSLRRPYGTHNEKILRLAVLCGTSNTMQIMSDSTGNRRIIPIEVINVNKELYNSIDKKALFMEAFELYKAGFDWRVSGSSINYLNKDQERYEMVVAERELIDKYFSSGDQALTTTEIKIELEHLTQQKLSLMAIGREMEKLGFERKTVREGKATTKKWMVDRIGRSGNQQTNTF